MISISPLVRKRGAPSRADGPKPFWQKLYLQVLAAVILGAALGYLDPHLGVALKPLADAFIKAIRVLVLPIIFATVVVGIATIGDLRQVARIGVKSLIYFEVVSTLALLIGLAVGNLYHFGAGINADPATLDTKVVSGYVVGAKSLTLVDFLLGIIPKSFIGAFASGDILPVLFLAVLFGLALCQLGPRARPLVELLDIAAHALFGMVRFIMYWAPLGALGAIAFTVGKYGVASLERMGELVAGVYVVSILFVVIVLGGALRLAGFSLWRVLAYFKDEIIFVFCATSAEAMIPRSMAKLEKLGCPKEVVGLVMPAGFSFNMDGTAVYMTMAVLFIANATNIHLSVVQQLTILFVMLFTSKGAAGVTGGGFIALAATMPALGVLPIGGLALLVGIDRFMAEIRAATNLTSNVIATLVVGRWVGAVDMETARRELTGAAAAPPPTLAAVGD
ncbi:MAG TPA: C4-dicarboxylate transporter DctA [Stellaceae bacterium]|nr:C4-dicarboxylate transporter DctA [Stellaceae bacterium]